MTPLLPSARGFRKFTAEPTKIVLEVGVTISVRIQRAVSSIIGVEALPGLPRVGHAIAISIPAGGATG